MQGLFAGMLILSSSSDEPVGWTAAAGKMLFCSHQERIDGKFLQVVRRAPVDPAKAFVFTAGDGHMLKKPGQVNDDRFLHGLILIPSICWDQVPVFEAELGIEMDIGATYAGFFFQFTQGALQLCFAAFHVSFGEVESAGMLHQQKLQLRLLSEQEEAAGSNGSWGLLTHRRQHRLRRDSGHLTEAPGMRPLMEAQ